MSTLSLRLLQRVDVGAVRPRWHPFALTAACRARRRLSTPASAAATRKGGARHPLDKNAFLVPGLQPVAAAAAGPDLHEGDPPSPLPLPVLNLAAVLSPGQYCKASSGSKSGHDAAERLVRARQELQRAVRAAAEREDLGASPRRAYAVAGHGVPCGLLSHLTAAAGGWLLHGHGHGNPTSHGTTRRTNGVIGRVTDAARGWLWDLHPEIAHLAGRAAAARHAIGPPPPFAIRAVFTSAPRSQFLDQRWIRVTDVHGAATTLDSLPEEWGFDLEMCLVVLDRIAGRAASLAAPAGEAALPQPPRLRGWRVTVERQEVQPLAKSPEKRATPLTSSGVQEGQRRRKRGQEAGAEETPTLTIEWVRAETEAECWDVVLRLWDGGGAALPQEGGPQRGPVSVTFEANYAAP